MSFKALVTQNERGRSMVEILGVLAIIGVLTFGGIQGYKYAMDKHRANDIVHSVNMRATDIWHLYQDGEKELPDSPEEDAFPEYGEMTQTGFEILVTSHPPVAFRTWVNDVPSAVCQKVLQENLNDAIQGLKFVQVGDVDAENLIRYTGDTAICGESGTMNQMVFTSFLDEDGGAVANEGNGDNNAMESCVENEDCSNLCGIALCDTNTFQCDNACANGQVCKPNEDATSGTCVDCVVNTDCPVRGQICNDLTNTCVTPPDSCELGVTFRSKNGVCIPCEDAGSIIISKDVFEFPELNIKDELTGEEQCQSCSNHQVATNKNGTTYCSVGCVTGANYQLYYGGCAPCYNEDGTINLRTERLTYNENIGIKQCLACDPKRFTYNNGWLTTYCSIDVDCQTNQFKGIKDNGPYCFDCTDKRNERVWMLPTASLKMHSLCTSCPEYINGIYTKRYILGDYCYPLCEQPTDAVTQIEICKANPSDEKCTRKWQNESGQCFECDEITSSGYVGSNETLRTLCLNCGRRINDGGYCLPQEGGCSVGQILNVKGECVSCDSAYTQIESDTFSGCTTNCKKDTSTNKYALNGDKQTKWVYEKKDANGKITATYCYKICPDNQWQNEFGACHACNNDDGRYGNAYLDYEHCDKPCLNTDYQRYNYSNRCVSKIQCPDKNGVKYFRNTYGECTSCNSTGLHGAMSEDDCLRCNNRIYTTKKHCLLVDPGKYGICNGSEAFTLTDNLENELKNKAEQWLNGKYDDEKMKPTGNGYFQENWTSTCYSCDTTKSIESSLAQCKSCMNRRYTGGICYFGQCEETSEFLNVNYACTKCANSYNRSASEIEVKKKYLCESCENRRIMTQNSSEKSYCVPNDCSLGFEWQTASSGSCISCTSTDSKQEIGAESVYREQCEECNRVAYSITDGTKEIWYCSRRQPDNKKYFVNIDGGLTACNTNGDVEIPNTEKAKTICSECLDVAREAYVEDGKAYCSKL